MPVESADYISQLDPLSPNPSGHDVAGQGDDQIRLIKHVLKETFPNLTAAVTPNPTELNSLVGVTSPIQTQLNAMGLFTELSKKNLIWNGMMDCWQEGLSEAGVTATTRRAVPDGWRFGINSHGTWSLTQSVQVPTVAQVGKTLSFSWRALVTTADASVSVGSFVSKDFIIEGTDFQELYLQPFCLSFWVQSSLPGTYCVAFRNFTPDRSYVATYTIDLANTPELKVIPVTAVPVGGNWNFQEGSGLVVSFALAAGATFQTTAGVWQSGNFLATSAQVNLGASINNAFYLTDVRLHGGGLRAPTRVLSFAEILLEARRRYWKSFPYAQVPAENTGNTAGMIQYRAASAGAVAGGAMVYFPVSMRGDPAIVFYNPDALGDNWRNLALNVNSGEAAVAGLSRDSFFASSTQVAGDLLLHRIGIHATADARF